jgi:hypothetical protein
MRAPNLVSLCLFSILSALSACGPGPNGGDGPDGGGGTSCSGDEERCSGNLYQTCVDGEFQTDTACPTACNLDLGGCVECDPTAGNTCDGNVVVTCNADGTFGSDVEDCGADMLCQGGECTRECTADGVDLVYVVDQDYNFLSFDPRLLGTATDPFTPIGALNCPAGAPLAGWTSPATPFSMSVDRDGTAKVLYTSGEIFDVDITSAACSASTFQPHQQSGAWELFGMGYSTDTAGGDTEKLYIAGGPIMPVPQPNSGYIDPGTQVITNTGAISVGENSPELSGTGDAKVFAYFPGTNANGFVQEISKTNGDVTGTAMQAGPVAGGPAAWAFAHWGGKFYIFITDNLNFNSQVQVVDRATGGYDGVVLQNLPNLIVGAGVSTCAPIVVE